jgi:hypothetical protein
VAHGDPEVGNIPRYSLFHRRRTYREAARSRGRVLTSDIAPRAQLRPPTTCPYGIRALGQLDGQPDAARRVGAERRVRHHVPDQQPRTHGRPALRMPTAGKIDVFKMGRRPPVPRCPPALEHRQSGDDAMWHDQRCAVNCASEPRNPLRRLTRALGWHRSTRRMWLTEDAYNRMKVELANLLGEALGLRPPELAEACALIWPFVIELFP